MKKIQVFFILLGLLVLPLFQNCGVAGENKQTGGLYVGEDIPDCLSEVVDCGPKEEYLEVTIDLSNPSVFSSANTTFELYGRCNTGNYDTHAVHIKIIKSATLATLYEATKMGSCGSILKGKYSETIDISNGALDPAATAFNVRVTMYGYLDGAPISNNQSNGSANIDMSLE
ncbi:MAG: hypothetical protein IT287_03600 [Bdellovibrionaceae bacterium]|nr:hypothetical protein [Pseudobdellovibrionaceae bacterium]